MSLQPMIGFVVGPLIASVAAMTYGAATNNRGITILAAMAFAMLLMAVAGRLNSPYWTTGTEPHPADALYHTMRRNTRLAALTYAWAGAAFFAIYGLTDVVWRHGFQYGTLATLIAAVLLAYVHRMGEPGHDRPPHIFLTVAHGGAVSTGLLFLLLSGKLATMRGDWPANYIFLFGGLALLGLCVIALRTQWVLETPGAANS